MRETVKGRLTSLQGMQCARKMCHPSGWLALHAAKGVDGGGVGLQVAVWVRAEASKHAEPGYAG